MRKYHINVFYSEADGGYIADVPDLESCSAFGKTQEEAMREVMIAIEIWIETAEAEGDEIPEPRYKPAIYQTI